MAIFLIEQLKENIVNDKFREKATTQTNEHQHQHYHHQYYCYYSQQRLYREVDETDDDEVVGNFYYYIKQCYQLRIENRTLYQRTNYPTVQSATVAKATSTLSHVLHSLSYNFRSFVIMMLMCYLLLVHCVMAEPQSCILCDKNDLQAKDPQTNFEEFLFEHQVTRQDAINALRQLNESFYEGTSMERSCNGVRCTEKVMRYCLGPQFINDHCWCEVGHSTEGLPFVPHICYVGEKVYKTSVGSCFFYEEVKDCCCSPVLAKEWRHISAGSTVLSKIWFQDYYVLCVIFRLFLLATRSFI